MSDTAYETEPQGEVQDTSSPRVSIHFYFREDGEVASVNIDINERGINARTVAGIISGMMRAARMNEKSANDPMPPPWRTDTYTGIRGFSWRP